MNILLLAAGFGTRLQEYGAVTPKGLIPTATGTLMDHVLHECQELKASVALVTNDRFFSTYTTWLQKNYPSLAVKILNDGAQTPEKRLGALGDILFSIKQLGWENDDLLVLPSDTYFAFSLQDFVRFATEENLFSTVVRDMQDKSLIADRLGCPTIRDERIIAFVEKPSEPLTSMAAIPFYYYPKRVLPLIAEYAAASGNMDAPGSIIPWFLSKQLPVAAYQIESPTLDVGTPVDVDKVRGL